MPLSILSEQPFPAFSLPYIAKKDETEEQGTLSNESMAGKPFVIFIYPKDQTSGCTLEACGFAALYQQFQKLGVEIIGISRDSISAHRNFITKQSLPYPLLSDTKRVWLEANGLVYDAKMYGQPVKKVHRTTAFVDANGVVLKLWESVSPPGHAQEVLDWAENWASSERS